MYIINHILIHKYGYNLLLNSVNTFKIIHRKLFFKLNNHKQ